MKEDDEKRRAQRARELREEIAGVGEEETGPPHSPHEFVQERMRELSEQEEEKEDEEGCCSS